jgi:hypothetical protein
MTYFESLPDACPELDAKTHEGVVYRLVSVPINDSDFLSHRALFPEKTFHASECRAMSLSVFTDLDAAKKLLGLPNNAGKKVVAVKLNEHAGVIKRTGKPDHHHSWWRSKNFAVLNAVEVTKS